MEKRLGNFETENGYVSIWFDNITKKPISVLFYPDEDEDKFVEILIEEMPKLMREVLEA